MRCRATGALRHGLPFTARVLPPAVETVRAHALKQAKEDRAFAELLLVARETGLEALDMACRLAQAQGHLTTSVVLNELRRPISAPIGRRAACAISQKPPASPSTAI